MTSTIPLTASFLYTPGTLRSGVRCPQPWNRRTCPKRNCDAATIRCILVCGMARILGGGTQTGIARYRTTEWDPGHLVLSIPLLW
jgi:hypothetical protein